MKPVTIENLRERYKELCAYRDKKEAEVAHLRAAKEQAANEAEVLRVRATVLAKELMEALGGAEWFALKKEIGMIARMLNEAPEGNE